MIYLILFLALTSSILLGIVIKQSKKIGALEQGNRSQELTIKNQKEQLRILAEPNLDLSDTISLMETGDF